CARMLFDQRDVGVFFAMAKDVFHDDDRGVDDDAEVDCAEREQIGGKMGEAHAGKNEEQCERHGDGNEESSPEDAKKQNENDQHQTHAFEESLRDTVNGGVHQLSAVAVRYEFGVGRKNAAVEGGNLRVYAFENLRGVGPFQKKDDSGNGVGIVVLAENAATFESAKLESSEIFDKDGSAIFREDDDIAEILKRANKPDAANHVALFAPYNDAAAGVGVIGLNGSDHLR